MENNTTITLEEMKMIAKGFLSEAYRIAKMPNLVLNGRLGRATTGQYFYNGAKKHTIEIAKRFDDVEEAVGTLLHELIHYALHINGSNFDDGSIEFELNLAKYNAPSNYGFSFFKRNFGLSAREFCDKIYLEKDMLERYTNMILEKREFENKSLSVASKKSKEDVLKNIKLEKTKISTLLHEYKMSYVSKNDEAYKILTNTVNAIDNTRAKDKEAIIKIYKEFLDVYYNTEMFKPDKALLGIIVLINEKVGN